MVVKAKKNGEIEPFLGNKNHVVLLEEGMTQYIDSPSMLR